MDIVRSGFTARYGLSVRLIAEGPVQQLLQTQTEALLRKSEIKLNLLNLLDT